MVVFKKFSKGLAPAQVGLAQRRTIEDRLKKKTSVINRLMKKLYPKVKKAEVARLKAFRASPAKGVEKIKDTTPGQ